MVRICVMGAAGRMGKSIIQAGINTDGVEVTGAVEQVGSSAAGKDVGLITGIDEIGLNVSSDIRDFLEHVDVIIDFTTVSSTLALLDLLCEFPKPLVIGTTGFSTSESGKIDAASKRFPIVISPNMSVGVNVLLKVLEKVAGVMGDEYDMEIVEAHHKHKKDAPSGTALKMGEVMAAAVGSSLNEIGVFERSGIIGERKAGTIGIQTLRGGDIVGEHTAMFCGSGERLEITHKATSRQIFANGAIRAAKWVADKKNNRFDMNHVLELDKVFG